MYWKVFDNIPISNETIRAILDRGALPDSITRYKRDVIKVEKELKRLKEMTG
jgi:predicted Zn-dependent protease with MMP-like domain